MSAPEPPTIESVAETVRAAVHDVVDTMCASLHVDSIANTVDRILRPHYEDVAAGYLNWLNTPPPEPEPDPEDPEEP